MLKVWTRNAALILVAAGFGVGLLWLLLGPVATAIAGPLVAQLPPNEQVAAVAAVRGLCAQLATISIGVVPIIFTARKFFLDREKQRLDEDKHVTDRFSGAVGHLGSAEETVRAGGVRTLARIMTDSPRDHDAVLDTLAGALRHWSAHSVGGERVPDDVTAVLHALRTRPARAEQARLDLAGISLSRAALNGARLTGADLSGTGLAQADLQGADLGSARLRGGELTGAQLAGAVLRAADLTGANLDRAQLTGADLTEAVLTDVRAEGATLTGANLTGATLRRARLRGVALECAVTGADLTDADLRGADLRQATGLTPEMIAAAVTDRDTRLPGTSPQPTP